VKQFTPAEIDAGIRKLRRRIEEVKSLDPSKIRFGDARIETVESNIRETIREVFGPNSPEFYDHQYHKIWHGGNNYLDSDEVRQEKFAAGIPQATAMLEGLIGRLEEKRADVLASNPPSPLPQQQLKPTRRVFVVHGHDEEAKLSVARFLEQLRLEAIILSERPNQGRTIIEKFEHNADVSYAVVLLTPDDIGFSKSAPDAQRPRARQNVILELGYFIGQLTRARVCALYKGSVELPSDFHGVLYVPMDAGEGWKLKLAKEMKAAGLEVDLNLVV